MKVIWSEEATLTIVDEIRDTFGSGPPEKPAIGTMWYENNLLLIWNGLKWLPVSNEVQNEPLLNKIEEQESPVSLVAELGNRRLKL